MLAPALSPAAAKNMFPGNWPGSLPKQAEAATSQKPPQDSAITRVHANTDVSTDMVIRPMNIHESKASTFVGAKYIRKSINFIADFETHDHESAVA